MRKIGIITWHYGANHGSVLQALSLSNILCEMGYDALVINYTPSRYGRFTPIRLFMGHILSILVPCLRKTDTYASDCFRKKYLRQSKPIYNNDQLLKECVHYNTIICGSDQIWAPNVINPVFFAHYAPKDTLKISYAASIGLNYIPNELIDIYKTNLADFKHISVREDIGKDLLQRVCGYESEVVLDPTLLHDSKYYSKFENKVKGVIGNYIFCYFLNSNHNYTNYVKEFADRVQMKVIGISNNEQDSSWMKSLKNTCAGDFLYLIRNSKYVFTDSYHGSIFSILYKKNFWIFQRFTNDDPICQNSRIIQLQKYFNLRNIIKSSILNYNSDINYDYIEMRLKELREKSINYLINALE